MAEKKKTTTVAAAQKATPKKAAAKKTVTKKAESVQYNAEYVGFKAGDVYQALASAGKPMSVAGIAKAAKISEKATLLGMGWLLKEGKIKEENGQIVLA